MLLPYKEQCEHLKQERAALGQQRAALAEIEQEEAIHGVKWELRARSADLQLQGQREDSRRSVTPLLIQQQQLEKWVDGLNSRSEVQRGKRLQGAINDAERALKAYRGEPQRLYQQLSRLQAEAEGLRGDQQRV